MTTNAPANPMTFRRLEQGGHQIVAGTAKVFAAWKADDLDDARDLSATLVEDAETVLRQAKALNAKLVEM